MITKTSLQILMRKIVIKAHWFLHFHFSVILAVWGEFQWENTQMKKHWNLSEGAKKAKKGQQMKHSTIFLSLIWLQFLNHLNLHTTPWFTYVALQQFAVLSLSYLWLQFYYETFKN